MNVLAGIIAAALLLAVVVSLLRAVGGSFGAGESAEKELLRLCRGDKQMAERLVSGELERGKTQGRKAAVRAAIYSLKRDNR